MKIKKPWVSWDNINWLITGFATESIFFFIELYTRKDSAVQHHTGLIGANKKRQHEM